MAQASTLFIIAPLARGNAIPVQASVVVTGMTCQPDPTGTAYVLGAALLFALGAVVMTVGDEVIQPPIIGSMVELPFLMAMIGAFRLAELASSAPPSWPRC